MPAAVVSLAKLLVSLSTIKSRHGGQGMPVQSTHLDTTHILQPVVHSSTALTSIAALAPQAPRYKNPFRFSTINLSAVSMPPPQLDLARQAMTEEEADSTYFQFVLHTHKRLESLSFLSPTSETKRVMQFAWPSNELVFAHTPPFIFTCGKRLLDLENAKKEAGDGSVLLDPMRVYDKYA